jgi:hypothetical protein
MIYHPFSGAHFTADNYGNVTRATIEVRDAVTGSKAQLYKDMFGAATLTNSFQSDNNGFFIFYTKTGRYNISATLNGVTTVYQDVDIIGVAAQEFDVSETAGTSSAFNTIQDAVNYLSRVIPSHNATQRYKLNIYGNVGALTSYSSVPLFLNCVENAQIGDMNLFNADIEVSGDLITGNIIGERTRFTTGTSSTLSCKRIKADRQSDFVLNSNVTSSQSSASDTNEPVFWAINSSALTVNGVLSLTQNNANSLLRSSRSSFLIIQNYDVSSNIGYLAQSFASQLRVEGNALSSVSVRNSIALAEDNGDIQFKNTAASSFIKVNTETNSKGFHALNGGRILASGSALTANGFSFAAFAERGTINASTAKIAQGTSSNLANITTNAVSTNGSAIFI